MPPYEMPIKGVAVATAGTLYTANTTQTIPKGRLFAVSIVLNASSPALVGILSGKLYLKTGEMKVYLSDIAPLSVGAGISWSTGTPINMTGQEQVGIEYTSDEVESAPIFTVGVLIG